MPNNENNNGDKLHPIESHWGKVPDDQFGYSNEKERHAKRGLEDWELTESGVASEHHFPKWFLWSVFISAVCAISFIIYYRYTSFGKINSWVSDAISIELLVFFLLCVSTLLLVLINFIQQTSKNKKGERIIFIFFIIGVLFAIAFGILQLVILGHQI